MFSIAILMTGFGKFEMNDQAPLVANSFQRSGTWKEMTISSHLGSF
jgi:hypothetical protein